MYSVELAVLAIVGGEYTGDDGRYSESSSVFLWRGAWQGEGRARSYSGAVENLVMPRWDSRCRQQRSASGPRPRVFQRSLAFILRDTICAQRRQRVSAALLDDHRALVAVPNDARSVRFRLWPLGSTGGMGCPPVAV